MAVKILSRSGISLSSMYDVKGSQAPVVMLEPTEVTLVHEMGSTIFSERFSGNIRRGVTSALLQNAAADIVLSGLGAGAFRVLGVVVLSDINARTSAIQVSMRDPLDGREVPFLIWNTATDAEQVVRIVENGAAATNFFAHQPAITLLPTIGLGVGQPQPVNEIVFRILTSGFGAGTVTYTCLAYIAFAQVGGPSSHGLPIPSW